MSVERQAAPAAESHSSSVALQAATQRPPQRSWADWAGFLGFLAFGAWLLSGPGALSWFLVVPVVYEVAIASTFLVRGRPRRSANATVARLAAYGSTFLIPAFIRGALIWKPTLVATTPIVALRLAGGSLLLFGLVLGFWPLWHLRGSFSIEPAARELVTAGPYRIARHPMYASYVLTYGGLVVLRPTVAMVLIYAFWVTLTRYRIECEERVLTDAFPEYADYRREVGAFGLKIRRRRAKSEAAVRAGVTVS